jgi:multisubunit Na+/H+ antiporter MnhB subunit
MVGFAKPQPTLHGTVMNDTTTQPDAAPRPRITSPVLNVIAHVATPLTVYVSLIIFFQGHNQPGGGFIAGVQAAAAGVVALMAWGLNSPTRFSWWYVPAMALGVLPAAGPSAAIQTLLVGSLFRLCVGDITVARFPWWRMSVVGLFIALLTGAAPLLAGLILQSDSKDYAFMNHTVWHLHYPIWGEDHLPSAGFFDTGVYLIVFGTLMTVFVELGKEDR